MTEEETLSRLLYRDGLMLVINKPAGVPVHAGPGGGPNMEQYFGYLRFGLPAPPALAHRLDRDTSGCLVLGRHRRGLSRLGKLFSAGRVEKTYWAVVEGSPAQPEGRIDLPLRKQSTRKDRWWMEGHPEGQPAVTDYKLMGQAGGLSWLELYPRTGRTHQIRVHTASALGCPVRGDAAYGAKETGVTLHLHARAVTLPLYPNKPAIAVTAPPPEHMKEALAACGWCEEATP